MLFLLIQCDYILSELADAKSRALDNLGRVHARSGEFAKAIEVQTDKLAITEYVYSNIYCSSLQMLKT